jgi:hypothetical protein
MRPTQRVQTTEGNLDGQVITMGIDEGSFAHIMGILTDLYSDTELAIIREYSCNARDSHIEAGVSRPIEVTTPSTFAQDFIVRDFGIGLSIDEISEIYSRYGASTKRGTNEQTGMLGLGCKSGLTYAPSFQVTSWKNGVKTQVLVSRNAEGVGIMEVLDTCASDEPTGVEIRIPSQARNTLAKKAQDFFAYWEKGTVLLDGAEPKAAVGTRIGNFLFESNSRNDKVIMGGVTYPALGWNPFSQNVYGHVTVFAEIGDVNFTPAREELMDTAKTKAFIQAQPALIKAAINAQAAQDIAGISSHAEAVAIANKWRRISSAVDVSYQGVKVPVEVRTPIGTEALVWDINGYSRARKGSMNSTPRINMDTFSQAILVTGCTNKTVSPGMRDRLEIWAEDNDIEFSHAIFTDKEFGAPWAYPQVKVDYADIKAIKIAKAPSAGGTTSTRVHPYDLLTDGDGTILETSQISQNVLYGSPADFPKGDYRTPNYRGKLYELAQSLGFDVVLIGKNRWEKFVRDFPQAQLIHEYFQRHYDTLVGDLDEAGRARNNASNNDRAMAKFLFAQDSDKVLDRELAKQADWMNSDKSVKAVTEIERLESAFQACGLGFRGYRSGSLEWAKPIKVRERRQTDTLLTAYPMCYNSSQKHRAHQLTYINAAFAATKGN